MTELEKSLKGDKIQSLKLRKPLCVLRGTTLREVFRRMRDEKKGHAIVLDGEQVVGIFTERDVLTKVIEQKVSPETPVEKLMTPNPKVLSLEDSVAKAIEIMNKGKYRHLPLIDGDGKVQGVLGVRDIIRYLAEHFPHEVYNLPPNPHQVMRSQEGA